ncbi:hypothetical protein AB4K20DRAFT_1903945 [Rhizopus microsporus]
MKQGHFLFISLFRVQFPHIIIQHNPFPFFFYTFSPIFIIALRKDSLSNVKFIVSFTYFLIPFYPF